MKCVSTPIYSLKSAFFLISIKKYYFLSTLNGFLNSFSNRKTPVVRQVTYGALKFDISNQNTAFRIFFAPIHSRLELRGITKNSPSIMASSSLNGLTGSNSTPKRTATPPNHISTKIQTPATSSAELAKRELSVLKIPPSPCLKRLGYGTGAEFNHLPGGWISSMTTSDPFRCKCIPIRAVPTTWPDPLAVGHQKG